MSGKETPAENTNARNTSRANGRLVRTTCIRTSTKPPITRVERPRSCKKIELQTAPSKTRPDAPRNLHASMRVFHMMQCSGKIFAKRAHDVVQHSHRLIDKSMQLLSWLHAAHFRHNCGRSLGRKVLRMASRASRPGDGDLAHTASS